MNDKRGKAVLINVWGEKPVVISTETKDPHIGTVGFLYGKIYKASENKYDAKVYNIDTGEVIGKRYNYSSTFTGWPVFYMEDNNGNIKIVDKRIWEIHPENIKKIVDEKYDQEKRKSIVTVRTSSNQEKQIEMLYPTISPTTKSLPPQNLASSHKKNNKEKKAQTCTFCKI